MPNIRSFLLIALAFVAFLLWQAWQQDYAAPPLATDTPTVGTTTGGDVPGDKPSASAATPPVDASVPGDTATTPQDIPAAPNAAAAAATSDSTEKSPRITVQSDVLRLEVDTRGGSIVRAELLTYPIDPKKRDEPVVLLEEGANKYFVAQSGLVSGQHAAPDHRATYSAPQSRYVMDEGVNELDVPLTWTDGNGIAVTKHLRLTRGSYVIAQRHEVVNTGSTPWNGAEYRQLQRTAAATAGAFSVTNPEQYSFTGAAWYSPDEHFEKLAFEDFGEEPLKRAFAGGWAAMLQHYFFAAWLPPLQEVDSYSTEVIAGQGGTPRYLIRQVTPTLEVAPGATGTFESRLYVGPKMQDDISKLAPRLETVVDYGKVTVIAEPLFWLLKTIHKGVGNWGIAIILLTLLIKLAFYKLSEAQYRSMAKMRKLQPRLAALKERYGDDRQKMSQAQMELFQKEKINPFGGCLPILVQIPVFIALYWVLIESVELRQAPFLGWIDNLSDKDPYFVLPVLNGLAMWAAQKLSPAPGMDPVQQRIMQLMPIMFAVMFAFFPAGLVLYWTVNGVLGLAQQWVILKRVEGGEKPKPA